MQFHEVATVSLIICVSAEQVLQQLQHGAAEVQQDDRTSAGWLCSLICCRWHAGRRNACSPTVHDGFLLKFTPRDQIWSLTPAGILVYKGILMDVRIIEAAREQRAFREVQRERSSTTCSDITVKFKRPWWPSVLPSFMICWEHQLSLKMSLIQINFW